MRDFSAMGPTPIREPLQSRERGTSISHTGCFGHGSVECNVTYPRQIIRPLLDLGGQQRATFTTQTQKVNTL